MSSDARDDVVLSVRDLSKCYYLYKRRTDRLKQAVLGSWFRFYKPFWALKDVSFEMKRGEAIGIIGVNGSGKSTLLQIIAGTSAPSSGEVEVRGRIAALLELGSGFNPQFTGRENVYMAGAILGISRREMEERFDEIADFADIGEFMDQPVTLYSSGMHARLAFAVAVTVKPDILILDEILAVGDMGFQQKCVSRIRRMLEDGVSLLFVSHGAEAVKSLCQKGLLLVQGRTDFFGPADDAVNRYIEHLRRVNNRVALQTQRDLSGGFDFVTPIPTSSLRYGTGHAQIERARVLDDDGHEITACRVGERVNIEVIVRAKTDLDRVDLAFLVRDRAGVDLTGAAGSDYSAVIPPMRAGQTARAVVSFECVFRPGAYAVSLTLTRLGHTPAEMGLTLDHVDTCVTFGVLASPSHFVRYMFHHPAEISCELVDEAEAPPAPPAAAGRAGSGHAG